MKTRKGDTLVEVMIAIGIFSMIAISVVSVMSGGISGSQTALETTLAREAIDTQSEAIRFIKSSYEALSYDEQKAGNGYAAVWNKITDNAVEDDTSGLSDFLNDSAQYCDYSNDFLKSHAFIINPNYGLANPDSVIKFHNTSGVTFSSASTYPRLIFSDESGSLVGTGTGTNLSGAEGIYIIAVKDTDTQVIVNNGTTENKSAYYDFYIRTCWYGTGEETETTIATTIRLSDIQENEAVDLKVPDYYTVKYMTYNNSDTATVSSSEEVPKNNPTYTVAGNYLEGSISDLYAYQDKWCTQEAKDGNCPSSKKWEVGSIHILSSNVTLYPIFDPPYKIQYISYNGVSVVSEDYVKKGNNYTVNDYSVTRDGYKFVKKWCTVQPDNESGTCNGDVWEPGNTRTPTSDMTLYAVWKPIKTITATIIHDGECSFYTSTNGGSRISASGSNKYLDWSIWTGYKYKRVMTFDVTEANQFILYAHNTDCDLKKYDGEYSKIEVKIGNNESKSFDAPERYGWVGYRKAFEYQYTNGKNKITTSEGPSNL